MRRSVYLCFIALQFIGCAGSQSATPTPFNESRALAQLEHSPTFIEYRERNGKVSCLVDDLGAAEAIINVGTMHPERFEKVYSFKVISDGTIYLYDLLATGDDPWNLDYRSTDVPAPIAAGGR
jgi:hypothetical protein